MVLAAKEPSEADVAINQINLKLANLRSTLVGFLPPSEHPIEEVQDDDEEDMWQSMPEELGVGAVPPKDLADGLPRARGGTSLDNLRRQMLGPRSVAKKNISKQQHDNKRSLTQNNDQNDDEELSRAATISSLKKLEKPVSENGDLNGEAEDEIAITQDAGTIPPPDTERVMPISRGSKKRARSYMDDLLIQKANRKSKKKAKGKSLANG